MKTKKPLFFAVMSISIGVIIALALFIVGFRLLGINKQIPVAPVTDAHLYRKSEISELIYEHVPGTRGKIAGVDVELNNFGFRGPDINPEKSPGSIRIAFIGDSVMFGQGSPEDSTMPAQTKSILEKRRPGTKIESINGGVCGYNIYQISALLKAKILPLAPDIVVLNITEINDPEFSAFRFESANGERYKRSVWWKIPGARQYLGWKLFVEYIRANEKYVRGLYDPAGPTWPKFVEELNEIKTVCSDGDIALVAIQFPNMEDGDSFAEERGRLKKALNDMGIMAVDSKPSFNGHPWKSLVISEQDRHPNALGLLIMSDLIAKKIERENLLSAPAHPETR